MSSHKRRVNAILNSVNKGTHWRSDPFCTDLHSKLCSSFQASEGQGLLAGGGLAEWTSHATNFASEELQKKESMDSFKKRMDAFLADAEARAKTQPPSRTLAPGIETGDDISLTGGRVTSRRDRRATLKRLPKSVPVFNAQHVLAEGSKAPGKVIHRLIGRVHQYEEAPGRAFAWHAVAPPSFLHRPDASQNPRLTGGAIPRAVPLGSQAALEALTPPTPQTLQIWKYHGQPDFDGRLAGKRQRGL